MSTMTIMSEAAPSTDGSWADRAACRDEDPDLFVADDEMLTDEQVAAATESALAICSGCPVVRECLEYALENNLTDGVWGAMTPEQRESLRKEFDLVPHGTRKGYNMHGCRCDPCSEADRAYREDRTNPLVAAA